MLLRLIRFFPACFAVRALTGLFALSLLIGLPSGAGAQGAKKLEVVASFSILADLARQIGGERANVRSLVPPNGDAHAFEPTPAHVRQLAGADVYIQNGLGFEPWADRLLRASSFRGEQVVAARGVKALRAGRDVDPHAWHDVENVKIYVSNIREAFVRADPHGRDVFDRRTQAYLVRLESLDREIRAGLSSLPAQKRRAFTSHEGLNYFADAYGVAFFAPRGASGEGALGAQALAKAVRQARDENIGVIFYESGGADRRFAESLAREAGLRLGGRLFSGALSPEQTYITMMQANLRTLRRGLGDL
jgi:zinc/manganese transport system substrate-binding protein